MPTRSRFAGLKLDEGDRARLKQMETGGARMSVRTWRRVRTLLLLDLGYTVMATAEALGTYRRETARIGKRYLAGGLEHALGDDPRPKPAPMLDSTQQAAIVAMVCGPPPEGRARWMVRLVAMEAVKRGIAPQLAGFRVAQGTRCYTSLGRLRWSVGPPPPTRRHCGATGRSSLDCPSQARSTGSRLTGIASIAAFLGAIWFTRCYPTAVRRATQAANPRSAESFR